MQKWIVILLIAGVLVSLTVPAWSEYYQYRDANGVLRFTDDIASIPPDQRPKVTTHRSVASSPETDTSGPPKGQREPQLQGATKARKLPGANTWEGKRARKIAEFDRKQAELDRMYTDLVNQRTKLEAEAPSDKASFEKKAVFNKKVQALNAKIDRYEKELADLTQQVQEYNAALKKK